MSVKERLLEYLSSKGINANAFENSISVSKSYLRNTKNISAEVVSETLRVYSDLSAEWLLRGEGSMYKSKNEEINKGPHSQHISPQRYETLVNLLAEVTEDLKETVIENQKLYEEIEELKMRLKIAQSA